MTDTFCTYSVLVRVVSSCDTADLAYTSIKRKCKQVDGEKCRAVTCSLGVSSLHCRWLTTSQNAAQPVLEALTSRAKGGAPSVKPHSLLALAALSTTGMLPQSQVAEIISLLEGSLASGGSSVLMQAVAVSLAYCCTALHPDDWSTRRRIVALLTAPLCKASSGASIV